MIIPSKTRFVDEKIQKAFYQLENGDSSEKELFRVINQAMDNLEINAFCGIQIPKKQIPAEYKRKFGVENLWKYDLPKGWRLIYSIIKEEVLVVSVVVEWFDHKSYEKRFNY